MYFLFILFFIGNAVLKLHTHTFSLSLGLLYFYYSYCVLFCALRDGVCLSRNKMITYLLTYLLIYFYLFL